MKSEQIQAAFAKVQSASALEDLEDGFQLDIMEIHTNLNSFAEVALRAAMKDDTETLDEVLQIMENLLSVVQSVRNQVDSLHSELRVRNTLQERLAVANENVNKHVAGIQKYFETELGLGRYGL